LGPNDAVTTALLLALWLVVPAATAFVLPRAYDLWAVIPMGIVLTIALTAQLGLVVLDIAALLLVWSIGAAIGKALKVAVAGR
jgi:hypothetical protein